VAILVQAFVSDFILTAIRAGQPSFSVGLNRPGTFLY
jgi:hypothetical protein